MLIRGKLLRLTLALVTLALWSFCASNVNAQNYKLSELTWHPGTYYKCTHPDMHFLVVDSEILIYTMDHSVTKTYTTVVEVNKKSAFANGVYVKEKIIRRSGNFNANVGAAMAKSLIGKRLPYDKLRCNGPRYISYFLHGEILTSWSDKFAHGGLSPDCPLQRSLHGLTVHHVTDPKFELQDNRGNMIPVDSLEDYPSYESIYGYLRHAPTSPTMRQRSSSPVRRGSSFLSRSRRFLTRSRSLFFFRTSSQANNIQMPIGPTSSGRSRQASIRN
nr:PREDICTED: uncharacterized protein LOC109033503 isoform X2 [Bemisia tabaci]